MRKFPIPSVEFLDCLNQLAWIFCFLWPIIITLSRSEAKVTFMSPGINLPSRYQSSVSFIAPSKDRDSLDAFLKLHRHSCDIGLPMSFSHGREVPVSHIKICFCFGENHLSNSGFTQTTHPASSGLLEQQGFLWNSRGLQRSCPLQGRLGYECSNLHRTRLPALHQEALPFPSPFQSLA